MNELVEFYQDGPRCSSFQIAEGFNRQHKKVTEQIEKYKERFLRLEDNKNQTELVTRIVKQAGAGQPRKEILLNEQQSLFLGALFRNTTIVLDFKERLASDFVKQKRIIRSLLTHKASKEYIQNRAAGKIIRRSETDAIKEFKTYCEEQGSTNADKYYIVFSKIVNSTMFDFQGTFKNKRESMTATQLLDVKFADRIVERGIIEGMAQCLPYKDIYKLVKQRLISLAGMYGKSDVINKQLDLFEK